jgi:hypothetical protein
VFQKLDLMAYKNKSSPYKIMAIYRMNELLFRIRDNFLNTLREFFCF